MGGCVRDAVLGLTPKDLDVAVPADPHVLGRDLAQVLGAAFVALSPEHGVARIVVPASVSAPRLTIDLSNFSGSIEADLARRDFTINALALPRSHWLSEDWRDGLLDPFQGRQDLARKQVKAVARDIYQQDPGRLLRTVRVAARLRFKIAPETARLAQQEAPRIAAVSGERLRDEFLAILAGDGAHAQLEILDRLDLLCRIVPELAHTKGVTQPKAHHYWDVWGHLLHAVAAAEAVTGGHQNSAIYSMVPWTPELQAYFQQEVCDGHQRRTVLKLAALFHDIAKPQTKGPDATGRIRFLGHSELGAEMASRRLAALRVSSRGISMVRAMIEEHLRPFQMRQGAEMPTPRAVYRYFRDLGDVAVDTLYLSMADYLAAKGPELSLERWAGHARMIGHILQGSAPVPGPAQPQRLVDGGQLMRYLNLSPGPQVGRLLELIAEAQAVGEISTQAEALALAARALRESSTQSQE